MSKDNNRISVWDVTFCKTDKDGNLIKDSQGNVIKYVNAEAENGAFSWNDIILPSLDDDCFTYIEKSESEVE